MTGVELLRHALSKALRRAHAADKRLKLPQGLLFAQWTWG
jgi:hypothetical protein